MAQKFHNLFMDLESSVDSIPVLALVLKNALAIASGSSQCDMCSAKTPVVDKVLFENTLYGLILANKPSLNTAAAVTIVKYDTK